MLPIRSAARFGGDLTGTRLCLVCPYSWSRPGGVQAHVAGFAAALRRRGAEVDVVAPVDGVADGVIPLGRSLPLRDNGSVVRVALGPEAVRRARRAVRGGYDLVHVHEPMVPAVGLAAVLASTAPVVATFHMVADDPRWYRRFEPLVRHAMRRIERRIAVSQEARRFVASVAPGHYDVIPNGIDTAAYAPAPGLRRGGRLLFVGRGERRKGLPVLLDALALLDGATLDVVGVSAHELEQLARGAARPALERVRPLGRVSEAERRASLSRADVLCVPSLAAESFGVVVLEGMAAGVPVVASDLPGYRALLPAGAGRLVPPGDPLALAQAAGDLLADGAARRRMGRAALQAAQAYDWDAVADRVLGVYASAVAR